MKLQRYETGPTGTFGFLFLPDGLILHTLERPWEGNKPHLSCVPAGRYVLDPHSTEKYPQTWALVGDTVAHWPTDRPAKERSACVFHAGNWMRNTTGCILVGMERSSEDDSMILSSLEAMETLRLAIMSEEVVPGLVIHHVPVAQAAPDEGTKEFDMKSWLKSKTLWFNVIAGALGVIINAAGVAPIDPTWQLGIVTVGNFILRFLTTEAVTVAPGTP